ncbi:MAG: Monoacylglycerol lipase abhd12 [Alyxoria varia]|nr:MAG: Monoacylglycerol lipase abhd12 [Alyxoria varia]
MGMTFHGNAGHVGQDQRAPHVRSLLDNDPVGHTHVLAIDYRGFGHSTGRPTEAGLILDGVTAVKWAINNASVPTERILLMGHSLGTGVATATLLHFNDPETYDFVGFKEEYEDQWLRDYLKEDAKSIALANNGGGTPFAGLMLISGFADLNYRVGGIIPVLSPLFRWISPQLVDCLTSTFVVDTWNTAARLSRLTRAKLMPMEEPVPAEMPASSPSSSSKSTSIRLIHALDDLAIHPLHSDLLYAAPFAGSFSDSPELHQDWNSRVDDFKKHAAGEHAITTVSRTFPLQQNGNRVNMTETLVSRGGHNEITTFSLIAEAAHAMLDDARDAMRGETKSGSVPHIPQPQSSSA